jgi:AAA family ATPase
MASTLESDLSPALLADVLRTARGACGAPPAAQIAAGVACLSPRYMQQVCLRLGQPVLLECMESGAQTVAAAWPLAAVADGYVAIDIATLDSLGVPRERRALGFEVAAGISAADGARSPNRRRRESKLKHGAKGSPRKTRGRTSNDVVTHPSTPRNRQGRSDVSDFNITSSAASPDVELPAPDRVKVCITPISGDEAVDDASSICIAVVGGDVAKSALLQSDEYSSYLLRMLLRRYVTVGTLATVSMLGIDIRIVVNAVSSALDTSVVVVTSSTFVDVQSDVANSDPALDDSAEVEPLLEEVGGLQEEVASILELARVAFENVDRGRDVATYADTESNSSVHRHRPPRGALLHGPPGTGKSLVARAVARACGANLEVLSGPEIVGAMAGESEAAVSALFRRAYRRRPCVIVLDEVDAIAPRRDRPDVGSAERRLTAALLTLLDGEGYGDDKAGGETDLADGVFVVGTTNRPDSVDPAMRRAGRFDRELEIGVPNAAARFDILTRLSAKAQGRGQLGVTMDELGEIARVAYGFVGADLAALWRESVSSAFQRCPRDGAVKGTQGIVVTRADFDMGFTVIKPSALREVEVEVPCVRWADIGGMDAVKERLREAIELPLSVHGAMMFASVGVSPPRGLLLFGPPGCSKTLLAKAVATESGANFISVKGPELLSMWVGESEKAVRATFRRARLSAPCVVFFDEIDALASSRGSGGSAQSRVVAQLLTEMDGINAASSSGTDGRVVVIAATNRPDLLDTALMRPGRLGVQLHVGLPDAAGREAVLRVHTARVPVGPDVDVAEMVADGGRTSGMSGAELAAVVREAALAAMEEDVKGAREVRKEHFDTALKRVRPRTPPETLDFFKEYCARTRNVL